MDRIKTVWECHNCGVKMETAHREYRDMECCNKVLPKTFVPISEGEYQELVKAGCYNLEAEIDYQRHMRRKNAFYKREVM